MSEACIQAVRIKLSRTSYEQLNKPVIHDVIKSITLYCQSSTQNSKWTRSSFGCPSVTQLSESCACTRGSILDGRSPLSRVKLKKNTQETTLSHKIGERRLKLSEEFVDRTFYLFLFQSLFNSFFFENQELQEVSGFVSSVCTINSNHARRTTTLECRERFVRPPSRLLGKPCQRKPETRTKRPQKPWWTPQTHQDPFTIIIHWIQRS